MKERIKDGGPAFPVLELRDRDDNVFIEAAEGMTLRDYFAGQALVGILANPSLTDAVFRMTDDGATHITDNAAMGLVLTEWANDLAADMIAARTSEVSP